MSESSRGAQSPGEQLRNAEESHRQLKLEAHYAGLPWWLSGKESTCRWRRHGFSPWSGKIPHVLEKLSLWTTTIGPVL